MGRSNIEKFKIEAAEFVKSMLDVGWCADVDLLASIKQHGIYKDSNEVDFDELIFGKDRVGVYHLTSPDKRYGVKIGLLDVRLSDRFGIMGDIVTSIDGVKFTDSGFKIGCVEVVIDPNAEPNLEEAPRQPLIPPESIALHEVNKNLRCVKCGMVGAVRVYGYWNGDTMSHVMGFGGTIPYQCTNCGNVGLHDMDLEGYRATFEDKNGGGDDIA